MLLKNLLPENQPGAEQELLQHVLWIENCSADAQTKQTRNMFGILVYRADPQPNRSSFVLRLHAGLFEFCNWHRFASARTAKTDMVSPMTRVARGQANPSIAFISKRIPNDAPHISHILVQICPRNSRGFLSSNNSSSCREPRSADMEM